MSDFPFPLPSTSVGSGAPGSGLALESEGVLFSAGTLNFDSTFVVVVSGASATLTAQGSGGGGGASGITVSGGGNSYPSTTEVDVGSGLTLTSVSTGRARIDASGGTTISLVISGAPNAVSAISAGTGLSATSSGGVATLVATGGTVLVGGGAVSALVAGSGVTITSAGGSATISATATTPALSALTDVAVSAVSAGDALVWEGSSWKNVRDPYIIGAYLPSSQSSASQVIAIHALAEPVTFPSNFAAVTNGGTSYAYSMANFTNTSLFTVEKCFSGTDPTSAGNWGVLGSALFSAGTHSAIFSTNSGLSYGWSSGDLLRIVGPGTSDPTGANVAFTLAGAR